MRVKYENLKLKHFKKGNHLGLSSNTLQRYRNVINMLLPYIINPNNTLKRTKKASNIIFDNNSHNKHDVKRPQMTSNDLKTTQTNIKLNRENKNFQKAWSIHENIEINENYLDEIHNNNAEL